MSSPFNIPIPGIPGIGDVLKRAGLKQIGKLLKGGDKDKDYNGDNNVSKNERRAFELADRDSDGKLNNYEKKLRASFDKTHDGKFSDKELADAAKALKGH